MKQKEMEDNNPTVFYNFSELSNLLLYFAPGYSKIVAKNQRFTAEGSIRKLHF